MTRILFFFSEDKGYNVPFNNLFFSLSVLYGRLVNSNYPTNSLKYINLHFREDEIYVKYPKVERHFVHKYKHILAYYDVFDFGAFSKMSVDKQHEFVWRRAYEILIIAAKEIKNSKLLEAVEFAYHEGLKKQLNSDYKTLIINFNYDGQYLEAALWITFREDAMISIFRVEKEGIIIFEKFIEKVKSGNEFFLEMYKKLEFDGSNIFVVGHRDVEYLPLKFSMSDVL